MNGSSMGRRGAGLILGAVVLAALVLPPFYLSGYWVRVITGLLMYGALASAINIMVGLAGYPALGNIVFFGTGAYTVAVLMVKADTPFFLALAVAGVVAAVYAALLGAAVLRLRGAYFSIATIGINHATSELVTNLDGLTGGGRGTIVPFFPGSIEAERMFFYFLMLALMLLATGTVYLISRNRLGYGLRAIKADEQAASVMGVNTTRYKVLAWTISAGLTGLVGGAYAYWLAFLEPPYVFDIVMSVKVYIMAILGGAGTVIGPVVGAFFLELLSELIWGRFLEAHMLVLGIVVVLVVLFVPRGFVDLAGRLARALAGGSASRRAEGVRSDG
ncbi:MAG: branched-chain amino acid ABC transporter permease [Firmicutes bacterium]|nr:branched-chain amino acid ABC transporter permease [Bacillota bacterium]